MSGLIKDNQDCPVNIVQLIDVRNIAIYGGLIK